MDKHNNISEFDNLFKQSFEGASNPVPPGVWEGVSSATTGAGAGTSILTKIVGIKGAAIIGSVAVLVTTAVVLTNSLKESKQIENEPVPVEQKEIANTKDSRGSETLAPEIGSYDSKETEIKEASPKTEGGKATNNPVDNSNPISTNNGSVGNQPQSNDITPGKIQKSPEVIKPTGRIITISQTACINQQVDFTLQSSSIIKRYEWSLNGEPVQMSRQFMSFLFNKPGRQTVSVIAETEAGQRFETNTTIQVESANASFRVSQKDGKINLSAVKALKENQWFANQVLVKENQPSFQYEPTSEETMIVHIVTELNGCKDTARQTVVRKPDCNIDFEVHDVITPYNVDGFNDAFYIDLPPVDGYRLTIYNYKDSKVVFDSDDQNEKWNGQYDNVGGLVPGGSYSYKLVYRCDGKTITKPGNVTVKESKD